MGCCCRKTNLKEETLRVLADYGLDQSSVLWVGGNDFYISPEKFWELAEGANYNYGFGRQMIATDLTIVCDGGYLTRESYAGAEWWKFRQIPKKPEFEYDISRLMCEVEDDTLEGETLKEMNMGVESGDDPEPGTETTEG